MNCQFCKKPSDDCLCQECKTRSDLYLAQSTTHADHSTVTVKLLSDKQYDGLLLAILYNGMSWELAKNRLADIKAHIQL